ncbi:MAG: hypothetical protein IKT56_02855, partial [Clostridia bacterium]|nr:hypothetical protein [Clostridia bacterium]
GFLDKKTIGTYWVACQLEIEKNEGLELGSKENLKRAGELLDKVILETQAGGLSTEKSAYLRSKNELLKSLTMFTSTPTKQFSMLVSAIGTYNAYKDRVKNENATAKEKKAFEEAKAQLVRTATTLGVVIVIYVALSEVMKSFYDRDRKDKDGKKIGLLEDALVELGGATLGAIPLYGQIYEFLTSGYGISNSTVDFINDFMTASSDMTGLLADAITGEVINKQRAYRTLKNSVDVIAQLTGIPVRNVENALKGVCRMISPNTVYKYDSLYYTPSYTKDLSEAVNKGDEKLASTVLRLLYRNEKTGKLSTAAAEEIVRLYDKYPSVIASTLSNKITVDGEEIELNAKQFRKFRDIYSKADAEAGKLIKSDMYASLDDKGKARSIKTVYKAYFDKAKSSVLGTAETKVNSSTEFIPLEKLVLGSAYIDSLSGEGKKAQAVKWLEANGYTDTEIAFTLFSNGYSSEDILKTVVSALNSSTKDKEDLILTFGIDDKCIVSNGKIKILQKNKNAA